MNGSVPYFFTDYNLESAPNLLLMTVSRAYFKYRYFAARDPILFNRYNFERIVDYIDWLDTLDTLNRTGQLQLLQFGGKTIPKAVFRGVDNGKYRQTIYQGLLRHFNSTEAMSKYFDFQLIDYMASTESKRNQSLSILQQLAYQFMIVMDGYSVRDGLMYQMEMGAVILKQVSANFEWWHWNARDGVEWINFDGTAQLISTVVKLVNSVSDPFSEDQLRNITVNSKLFVDDYLSEDNVDCFFIQMLTIYNRFIFDADSVTRSDDDHMFPLPPDLY